MRDQRQFQNPTPVAWALLAILIVMWLSGVLT